MKRNYDGLEAVKIQFANNDVIASSNCVSMIQLELENGICISDEWQWQITYIGDQG